MDVNTPASIGLAIIIGASIGLAIIIFMIVSFILEAFGLSYGRYKDRLKEDKKIKVPKVYGRTNYKIKPTTFRINKFHRYVGVEIETIGAPGMGTDSIATPIGWKNKGDGSVNHWGEEYVNTPACGDKMFEMIDEIYKRFKKNSYMTDGSCGLHTHYEINPNLDRTKKVILFYSKFEKVLSKLHSYSRNHNRFCRPISRRYNFNDQDILLTKNLIDLKKVIYACKYRDTVNDCQSEKYNSSRYCAYNFHSIFYRGTLEIRLHAGTVNPEKIKNFLLINLTILNYLDNKKIEDIVKLKGTEEELLSLFDIKLKKYIKNRMAFFSNPVNREGDFIVGGKNVSITSH